MRNIITPFLSLILLLGVGGCNPIKDVKFESFKLSSFELESTSKASIVFTAEIDNPLETSISLVSVEGILFKDYASFARITLHEEVMIPPNTKEEIMVKVNVVLIDPMSLLSMGLNIRRWQLDDLRTSAKVTLKLGSGRNRTFKFQNIPLKRMVNSFQ